jgi:glycosyltransferase involved in cell wall biosynthesis
MNIWMVNPFDPLPGDPEQQGRYATLARLLIEKGHSVIWWTSSFSHRFKKPIDQQTITSTCKTMGIDVRFLSVPPYHRNVGLARLWNHYILARQFSKNVQTESNLPDVVLASIPPPILAQQATRFARGCKAKVIVDVQDLWPETFYRAVPTALQPFISPALAPWHNAARNAYRGADAIVGVADAYVDKAVELSGPKELTSMIPLGVDLPAFSQAATEGYHEKLKKPEGKVWLVYAGSLNRSYDCLTLLYAFAKIHKTLNVPTRLLITGRGELSKEIEQIIYKRQLTNVTVTGFLDFSQWAYLLSQCDVGFNASFPEAMIYLPNKIFYYFAAGLAVLNTIPGQCSQIVTRGRCGLNYKARDVNDCARAIEQLISDREELGDMRLNSQRLAQTCYDRKILYPRYVDFIERIAKHTHK